MRLVFLGTSSGAPTRERNVSALAFGRGNSRQWYLIDCGEGTQHRLMHTGLSSHRLRAIFITHVHGDHCYGLPGLLTNAAISGRTEPLALIAPAAIERLVRVVLDVSAAHLPYEIEFHPVEAMSPVVFDDFTVDVFPLSHRVPSYAFRFTERGLPARLDSDRLVAADVPRGPVWGRLQRGETVTLADGRVLRPADYLKPAREPRAVVIAGDNDTPSLLTEACRRASVLVHEATYTDDLIDERRAVWQHSSALQVARFAAEVNLPNLVLTHFSARFQSDSRHQPSISDVAREAAAVYHGNLILARDLGEYVLDETGRLC